MLCLPVSCRYHGPVPPVGSDLASLQLILKEGDDARPFTPIHTDNQTPHTEAKIETKKETKTDNKKIKNKIENENENADEAELTLTSEEKEMLGRFINPTYLDDNAISKINGKVKQPCVCLLVCVCACVYMCLCMVPCVFLILSFVCLTSVLCCLLLPSIALCCLLLLIVHDNDDVLTVLRRLFRAAQELSAGGRQQGDSGRHPEQRSNGIIRCQYRRFYQLFSPKYFLSFFLFHYPVFPRLFNYFL